MKVIISAFFVLLSVVCHSQTTDPTDKIDPLCLQKSVCNFHLYDVSGSPSTLPQMFAITKREIRSYAKPSTTIPPTTPAGYPGDPIFKDENNPNNCRNKLATGLTEDCYDNTNAMQYKVYYPQPYDPQTNKGYNYSTCPLPVYINVHGGGFSDCLDNPLSLNPATDNPLCLEMSRRGFVVFDVDYRLGLKLASPSTTISAQQQLAVYRASQDVRGAIRSIIRIQKDQDDGVSGVPTTEYKINFEKIFLGGNSAGSVTVLNVAYYTQGMLNQVNPYSGANSVQAALGDIDADFYYGGTDIVYQNRIQGVLALWGNFAIPPGSYDMSDPSKARLFFGTTRIPVICFHGEDDPVINIDVQPVKFPPRPPILLSNLYTTKHLC